MGAVAGAACFAGPTRASLSRRTSCTSLRTERDARESADSRRHLTLLRYVSSLAAVCRNVCRRVREDELDPAVLLSSTDIVIAGNRRGLATSRDGQLIRGDAALHQRHLHRLCATKRQRLIRAVGPDVVSVSFDHHAAAGLVFERR